VTRLAPHAALLWLQLLTDALMVAIGFALAAVLVPYPYPGILVPGAIFGVALLGRAGMTGLYDWPTLRLDLLLAERVIRASLWALFAAGLGVVVLRAPGPSRVALLGGWLLATGLVLAKRWAVGADAGRWSWAAAGEMRILLVTPPDTARRIEERFAAIPFLRFEHYPAPASWDPSADGVAELKRVGSDEIWILASFVLRAPALLLLDEPSRAVRLLWDLGGTWGLHLEAGAWPLVRSHGSDFLENALKRGFDLAFATVLLVGSLPVAAAIAVAIKATSPGPLFFRHQRVGKDGRVFTILKFRSMRADAEAYKDKPARGDARVTPVGRFLRQTGIDELPQIVNVLRGEMSFVGPRPEMEHKVDAYTPHEQLRLRAQPGITGLWQVNVHRSRAIQDTLAYDLYYLAHRSLLLDLLIIGATVVEIVKGLWGRSIFDV